MAPGISTDGERKAPVLDATLSERKKTLTKPIMDASLITADFDALIFQAAASLQIQPLRDNFPSSYNLISSPYNSPLHQLDLRTLDHQSALFAKALTVLKNVVPDYATTEYGASFNWNEVLSTLRLLAKDEGLNKWKEQGFYTVIFRSKLKHGIDTPLLYQLDEMSHEEACLSGGLLKYWFGSTDVQNQNLATCLWRTREDARLGGLGPWHNKARGVTRDMYESITILGKKFVVDDGALGFRIDEWDE